MIEIVGWMTICKTISREAYKISPVKLKTLETKTLETGIEEPGPNLLFWSMEFYMLWYWYIRVLYICGFDTSSRLPQAFFLVSDINHKNSLRIQINAFRVKSFNFPFHFFTIYQYSLTKLH